MYAAVEIYPSERRKNIAQKGGNNYLKAATSNSK